MHSLGYNQGNDDAIPGTQNVESSPLDRELNQGHA